MKCYYHNDLDGICSAAIVCAESKIGVDLLEVDYQDNIVFDDVRSGESVFIVDFSFKPETMENLLRRTKNIVWIDHHKTAMEYKYSVELLGLRDTNFSGCELTWCYFHSVQDMPTIVKMLGRYDVWDFSEYGSIPLNALQVGIKLWDHHPKSANWKGWLASNTKVEEISTQGEAILRFRESTYAGYIQNFAFHTTFENYKAVCCNAPEFRNQLFDSVDPTTYDIMVPFSFNGKTWKVSLYTTNPAIDVSEIAKKYGGGGHKQAAGFVCKELPKGLSHKIRVEGK